MKKRIVLPFSLGLLSLAAAVLAGNPAKVNGEGSYVNPDYNTELPESGATEDSFIQSVWGMENFAAKRLDEKKVVVRTMSEWGMRQGINDRKFDLTSFHINIDLEGLSNRNGLMFTFGVGTGAYASEAKLFSFDFVKATNNNTEYIMTLSTTIDHNISIPSFTDGGKWADDANFVGVQFATEDNTVDLKFNKVSETATVVTVNGVETTVNNSELYEKCVDGTLGYLSIGAFNAGFGNQMYVINDINDASDTAYRSSVGAFGKTKSALTTLKQKDCTSLSIDETLDLKKDFEAIPYADLYKYDKAFFRADYNEVKTKVEEAVEKAGVAINLRLLTETVEALELKCASLTTVSAIDEVVGLQATGADLIAKIDADGDMSAAQQDQFDDLSSRFSTEVAKILPAMQSVYDAAVTAYDTAASTPFADANGYLGALSLKNAIPTKYNANLSSDVVDGFATRIAAATAKVDAQVRFDHNKWTQGSQAAVVKKADNSIDLVTCGGFIGSAPEASSGLFNSEVISTRDFEFEFSITKFPEVTGSWFTIGVMEQPEPFINAEDSSVQNNKGIFFLITRVNSQTCGVQAFMMSMTCNRFYDAPLTQNIQIPMNQNMKLTFKEVSKTVAGVSGTYFEMKFGSVGFDQENITVNTVKTALTSREGHLIVGSSGFAGSNPGVMNIKSINGFAPLAESIVKEIQIPAPTTSVTEGTFAADSTGTVIFKFETSNEAVTSVKVDGTEIAKTNYSFANNKLTLKNAYLKTLSSGDHTVVASTAGGSCTWTLHVTGGSGSGDNGGNGGGCGGSIVAASALVTLVSALGLGLAVSKKKED